MTFTKPIAASFASIAVVLFVGSVPMNAQTPTSQPPSANAPAHQATLLLKSDIQGVYGKEMRVYRTVYPPGAINSKHYHTSHVAFYVLEGSGVWQEEGQPPVTLNPGDTLLVKPGTVHAHWNPSTTVPLVFTEFVIVDHGQRSTVKTP
jgi:quercetin dioxygenase-like cupin family protein